MTKALAGKHLLDGSTSLGLLMPFDLLAWLVLGIVLGTVVFVEKRSLASVGLRTAWYRVFLAITAGVVEEPLYRGYAVERLASLTGGYWRGGSLAVVASGLVVALIIAHVIGDAVGLVILPPGSSGS